jgi:hypothetical protein
MPAPVSREEKKEFFVDNLVAFFSLFSEEQKKRKKASFGIRTVMRTLAVIICDNHVQNEYRCEKLTAEKERACEYVGAVRRKKEQILHLMYIKALWADFLWTERPCACRVVNTEKAKVEDSHPSNFLRKKI